MGTRLVLVPVRRAGLLLTILTSVIALVVVSLAPVASAQTETPVPPVQVNSLAGDALGAAGPDSTPTWSCPGNLLQNPSFETGTGFTNPWGNPIPANWTHSGSGFTGAVALYNPKDGTRIGYVIHTTAANTDAIMYQQVTAAPGATFSLTFYSGTHEPSKHPTIAIRFYNGTGSEIGTPAIHTITSDLEVSGLGGPYTLSATAPAGAANLRVIFTDPASTATPFAYAGAKGDALCLRPVDYGDAPDTAAGTGAGNYNTLGSDNGPSHAVVTGVYLGAGVDPDNGSLQDGTATADDSSNTGLADDEDGVVFQTPLVAGKPARIQVTAGVAGCLNAWVDYNGNGLFTDSGEQIAANLAVIAGANSLNVTVPGTARGVLYSRFRFTVQCSQGGQAPTGPASSGEVEDYALAALGDYVWVDTNQNGVQDDGNTGLNGVTVNLLDGAGNAVLDSNNNPITTVTANNPVGGQPGWYGFTGLPAGSYSVQFVKPDGYSFTTPFQGGDPTLDSDADTTTGQSGSVTLAAGQVNPTIDAGLTVNSPTAVRLVGFSASGKVPWGGVALLGLVMAGSVLSQLRRQR